MRGVENAADYLAVDLILPNTVLPMLVEKNHINCTITSVQVFQQCLKRLTPTYLCIPKAELPK
jgi:hypothetical protein